MKVDWFETLAVWSGRKPPKDKNGEYVRYPKESLDHFLGRIEKHIRRAGVYMGWTEEYVTGLVDKWRTRLVLREANNGTDEP